MSKHINDINSKILQSNQDLYAGPNVVLKEFESVKKDVQKLSMKLERIYQILIQIRDRDNY